MEVSRQVKTLKNRYFWLLLTKASREPLRPITSAHFPVSSLARKRTNCYPLFPRWVLFHADTFRFWAGAHQCEACGRRFTSRSDMRTHQKLHQGATRCPCCYRIYSRVSVLRQHLHLVHSLTPEQVRRLIPTRPLNRPGPKSSP